MNLLHILFNHALAAGQDPAITPLPRSSTFDSLTQLLDRILQVGLLFGGVVVVIMIGFSAILFMTAGADPERRNKAKDVLKWTVIGYAIIVSSWLIITTVSSFFGVDIQKP